jgi:ABC-2 type transport system ATP-binding protein
MPQLVGLRGELALAGVEIADLGQRADVVTPPGQASGDLVELGAEESDVEHRGTVPGRLRRLHARSLASVPVNEGPAVVVDDLTIRYGARVAVDGLSLTASAGEVLAVLGPNGAGKTSTIETLEGYRKPSGGRVRVLGLDPIADHARLVPSLGVMLQEGGVNTAIRPDEVIRLYAAYYTDPRDPDELLERLGLSEVRSTPWRRLSGGERQRLSLALALVGRPAVAFLDEPTSGVDVQGRRVIREVVAELRAEGVCVVLATHELDEAERMADRVAVVDHGRLLALGSLAELTAGDDDAVHFRSAADLDTTALAGHLGASVSALGDERDGRATFRVSATGTPTLVASLTNWLAERDLAVDDLRTGGPSLEEVFLRLTDTGADPRRWGGVT